MVVLYVSTKKDYGLLSNVLTSSSAACETLLLLSVVVVSRFYLSSCPPVLSSLCNKCVRPLWMKFTSFFMPASVLLWILIMPSVRETRISWIRVLVRQDFPHPVCDKYTLFFYSSYFRLYCTLCCCFTCLSVNFYCLCCKRAKLFFLASKFAHPVWSNSLTCKVKFLHADILYEKIHIWRRISEREWGKCLKFKRLWLLYTQKVTKKDAECPPTCSGVDLLWKKLYKIIVCKWFLKFSERDD